MNEIVMRRRWIVVLGMATLMLACVLALVASKAAEATFRGTNAEIAFFSDRLTLENPERDWEIFTMNPDGSNINQLTRNGALDWEPAVSPNGQRIAFFSNRDGNNEIYVMNTDGTGQTRLTNNPASDQFPVFSSDGNTVIFMSQRDGNSEIYAVNADGSGTPTNLTNNPSYDGDPTVSPDGKIAFASDRDGPGGIYVMNSDGSNKTLLTNTGLSPNYLNYSPNGKKITFHADSLGSGDYEIYSVNADGSNLTNLTNSPDRETHPAPSPDGTKIAFERSFWDGQRFNQEIYTMNWDGSNWTRLTENPTGDAGPDWKALPYDDTASPEVSSPSPLNSATGVAITANISATVTDNGSGVDPDSLTNSTFTLGRHNADGSTTPVEAAVSYDSTTMNATLDPSSDLASNATYTATIKGGSMGMMDRAGNALVQDYSWSFTTEADTTAPMVDTATPTGAEVARGTDAIASFSEKMDPDSITTSTFKLFKCSTRISTDCATQITNVTVTPSADRLSATLNPFGLSRTLLAKRTTYKVVVTTGVTDEAGNPLDQDPSAAGNQEKVWYFNTGSR
jgi:Tol biopolymer transport system component